MKMSNSSGGSTGSGGNSSAFMNLWASLGSKSSLAFGRECASAATWMFVCLCIRAVVSLLRLGSFVPYGLIFALPALVYKGSEIFTLFDDIFPLLPVRLAECIMGRISQARLSVVIPAHFIGCIFSAVLFKLVCPLSWIDSSSLTPLSYPTIDSASYKLAFVFIEIFCVFLYVIIVLIVPDFIAINKLPRYWTSALTIPLFLVSLRGYQPSFHPAANYAIWYLQDKKQDNTHNTFFISSESTCIANQLSAAGNSDYSNITESDSLFNSSLSDLILNTTTSNNSNVSIGFPNTSSFPECSSDSSLLLNSSISSIKFNSNSTNISSDIGSDHSILENLSHSMIPLQFERLLGPFLGAIIAGLICAYFFPDDDASWKMRRKKVE